MNRYWNIPGTRLNQTVHRPRRVTGIVGHVRPRAETYRNPFHRAYGDTVAHRVECRAQAYIEANLI